MKTASMNMGPECPLAKVARGDFYAMATPLLIAAANQEQYDEFLWREGLIFTEAMRITGTGLGKHKHWPQDKILLLLPDWHLCRSTECSVQWWVEVKDGYTVQLTSPISQRQRRERKTAMVMALMVMAAAIITAVCMRY